MTSTQPERVYSDEEIQQRLTGALQHWYMEDGWLRRKYKTEGWEGTPRDDQRFRYIKYDAPKA